MQLADHVPTATSREHISDTILLRKSNEVLELVATIVNRVIPQPINTKNSRVSTREFQLVVGDTTYILEQSGNDWKNVGLLISKGINMWNINRTTNGKQESQIAIRRNGSPNYFIDEVEDLVLTPAKRNLKNWLDTRENANPVAQFILKMSDALSVKLQEASKLL